MAPDVRKDERPSGRAFTQEAQHRYGPRVHLLDNPFLHALLARIGAPESKGPEVADLIRVVYTAMLAEVAGRELPTATAHVPTRMFASTPRGVFRGTMLSREASVVIACVIRAGMIPAQTCFELLSRVIDPERVRIDVLAMARVLDDKGRVTGVSLDGCKIGGSVEGSFLLVPDPMGATGGTVVKALAHYRERYGAPRRVVAMPMIATPEYVKRVLDEVEDSVIYAARLDRGLSSPDVLATIPGERWAEERGLDEHQYIVPGAGGIGEVLNHSWA
ncbi:MAG TPA: uracil phosphoribosyltransferase [Planctomycetota bacterium]|nr:uracil phosphoribosyltransferase [Planctomycetota bacterium]